MKTLRFIKRRILPLIACGVAALQTASPSAGIIQLSSEQVLERGNELSFDGYDYDRELFLFSHRPITTLTTYTTFYDDIADSIIQSVMSIKLPYDLEGIPVDIYQELFATPLDYPRSTSVPEPSGMALLAAGVLALVACRRRLRMAA